MGLSKKMLMLACAASVLVSMPAFAEVNNTDLVNAIKKAQFLDEGTQVNVRIDGDKVSVSTFRNPHNNEKDLKIDAVLIAKAIFDGSGDQFARVTTYFYGADLSQYQEVSVTAGDVKSFASGTTGKDQLLAALQIEHKRQESNSDKVAKQLQSNYFAKPDFKVAIQQGSVVEINTPMPTWVSDEECKIDALTMAVNAMGALPEGTRQVKIAMADPAGKSQTRVFTFDTNGIKDLWTNVHTALNPVLLTKVTPTVDLQSYKVAEGPGKEGRQSLLDRLKELGKQGVGIGPFVQAFMSVEQTAKAGDENAVTDGVRRLGANLDAQEKAIAAAKEKRSPAKASASAPVSAAPVPSGGHASRWGATGDQPLTPSEVLSNPNALADRFARDYSNDQPKLMRVLQQMSQILRANKRDADAAQIDQRISAVAAKARR